MCVLCLWSLVLVSSAQQTDTILQITQGSILAHPVSHSISRHASFPSDADKSTTLDRFTTITLLYSFASSLGDFQFLYIDLFIIIPIAVASTFGLIGINIISRSRDESYQGRLPPVFALPLPVGRTLPYPDIHPKRPTGSLVSKRVLTSIISQTLINGLVQLAVFILVRRQPWSVSNLAQLVLTRRGLTMSIR